MRLHALSLVTTTFNVIVFENLHFPPSTRIQKVSILKSRHCGERFQKPLLLVTENGGYVQTKGKNGEKDLCL